MLPLGCLVAGVVCAAVGYLLAIVYTTGQSGGSHSDTMGQSGGSHSEQPSGGEALPRVIYEHAGPGAGLAEAQELPSQGVEHVVCLRDATPVTRLFMAEDAFELWVGDETPLVSVRDESDQNCCEHAFVHVWPKSAAACVGMDVVSVKYQLAGREGCPAPDLVLEREEEEWGRCNNYEPVITIGFASGEALHVAPVNNHNGYYPHTFIIAIDGRLGQVEVGKAPPDMHAVAARLAQFSHKL